MPFAAVVAVSLLAGLSLPTSAWAAAATLSNPSSNRPPPYYSVDTGQCTSFPGQAPKCPSPCFPKGELVYNSSAACVALLLSATNAAQKAEGRHSIVLPTNYLRLSVTKQMFVLTNLERISHGVPPLEGLSPYLSAAASKAAHKGQDPLFQRAFGPVKVWFPPQGGDYAFGGTWAGESVNALAAMFGWMYDDGWAGKGATRNIACSGPGGSGCWGHRDELLGEYTGTTCTDCIAGGGYASPATRGWDESYVLVLVRPVQFPTPLLFTWDGNVLPNLPPGWERTRAA